MTHADELARATVGLCLSPAAQAVVSGRTLNLTAAPLPTGLLVGWLREYLAGHLGGDHESGGGFAPLRPGAAGRVPPALVPWTAWRAALQASTEGALRGSAEGALEPTKGLSARPEAPPPNPLHPLAGFFGGPSYPTATTVRRTAALACLEACDLPPPRPVSRGAALRTFAWLDAAGHLRGGGGAC